MPRHKRDQPYRGIFRTTGPVRRTYGLDFYADSRALALDHAWCLTRDANAGAILGAPLPLELVKITKINPGHMVEPGSFYPLDGGGR